MNILIPHASFPDLRLAATSSHEGRHLPRWEAAGAVYHIALHLADSVPADQLRIWQEARTRLQNRLRQENRPLTDAEREELKAVYDERVERYLSSGFGECLLKSDAVQDTLREILLFGHGKDYALHMWCIMPNHLHVIVGSFPETSGLTRTLTTWKRISGHKINALCGRTGSVWQADGYTRIIRNAEEYKKQLSYVWHNPEAAGLTAGFARESYVACS